MEVLDEVDGVTQMSIRCNGRSVLSLRVEFGLVVEPRKFSGQNISIGFSSWAMENLSGDEQEAALILHRAKFVSLARTADLDKINDGKKEPGQVLPLGVCYTYSEGVFDRAKRNFGSSYDFTHDQTQLLEFRPNKLKQ